MLRAVDKSISNNRSHVASVGPKNPIFLDAPDNLAAAAVDLPRRYLEGQTVFGEQIHQFLPKALDRQA